MTSDVCGCGEAAVWWVGFDRIGVGWWVRGLGGWMDLCAARSPAELLLLLYSCSSFSYALLFLWSWLTPCI